MPMYVERPKLERASDLDQGDIIHDILVPSTPLGGNLGLLRQNATVNKRCLDYPAKEANLRNPGSELRVFCTVEKCSAVVLSNSCDNYQGDYPLLFAPIRAFAFDAHAATDAQKWEKIRQV